MPTTDLVYVVGGPTDDARDDLRHSLRSFAVNVTVDFRDVWVVGDVPEWFTGAKMPLVPHPDKFINQRRSLTAYVNAPGAADRFVLANDDMFVTEPVDTLPTCRVLRPLSSWAQVHRDALNAGAHPWDCWQCHIIDTADWTAQQTGTDPWLYECHTPLLFDTARLRDVINNYPQDRRFVVGEVYPIAGAGGPGEHCGNAKAKTDASFPEKLANPMPYLSASPDSWAGALGRYIRDLFPAPCRFETDRDSLEVAA